MDLPEPVREAILEGIEGGSLTFSGAAELAESHGIRPGAAAMRGQVRAALRKRRIEEAEETLRDIVSEFSDKPVEESLASLALLILRMAAVGLVEGSVGIKDIDLPKFLAVLPNHGKERARGAGEPGAREPAGSANQGAGGLSDAAAAEIRRKILGLDE